MATLGGKEEKLFGAMLECDPKIIDRKIK